MEQQFAKAARMSHQRRAEIKLVLEQLSSMRLFGRMVNL